MPIKIQSDLPACKTLEKENIFVMTETRAVKQDIRPLKIAIVNLMPTKIATETQLLRLLGNTPLQVEISLVHMESHQSKNTKIDHLEKFYITSKQALETKFDGMIITGAPVEQIPFEDVDYWNELCQIMDYAKNNVFCTLYICWGAQAGLYHFYNVPKYELNEKMFGVFPHKADYVQSMLLRGFDDEFYVPHSRHTEVRREDIEKVPELKIISESHTTYFQREARVLSLRYGLEDGNPKTLEEVGKEFNVTRERIRQIEAKALRKLRHPSRSKKLRDYLE